VNIFIIEPYTRTPGHFERWAVRTCEALAHLRNDVTLVTYGGISNPPPQDSRRFTVLKAAPDGIGFSDWRYHRGKIRMNSFRTFLRRELRELQTLRLAASAARRQPLSIVHFHDADPILLSLVIRLMLGTKRARNRPVIVSAVHEITRLTTARGIKRKLYCWLYRRSLGRLIRRDVDGVLVFDPSLKDGLVSHLGLKTETADRIRVLPHGIGDPVEISSREEARRRLNLDPNETVLLVFGILRKDKRLDVATEAVKGLPGCRLIVAGGPHDFTEATVKELIRQKGCEQSVSAEIAYLSEERMHDYFSACDAAIIPYDRSFKGQSGILTLACGHGKAMIASDVGMLGDVIKKHGIGFAVEPENASALREGLRRFLSLTPEERGLMEQRVRSYAGLMTWDSACRKWVDFYQDVLHRRQAPPESQPEPCSHAAK
jgi:glycosyltransferase involved in cell wall biosynthesis